LIHDLVDHGYGDQQPAIEFEGLLRVGTVRACVKVTREYLFDLRSGCFLSHEGQASRS